MGTEAEGLPLTTGTPAYPPQCQRGFWSSSFVHSVLFCAGKQLAEINLEAYRLTGHLK